MAPWVKPKRRTEKRIQWFLQYLPHLSVIGEFHSHTGKQHKGRKVVLEEKPDVGLSGADKKALWPGEICLIIGIAEKLKHWPWYYNVDGTISGTTDKHYIKLAAYHKNPKGIIEKAELVCPASLGFGVIRRTCK